MAGSRTLVGGGDALTAKRVKLLRQTLGFTESKDFAAHLGIGKQRWNAFENGAPLSKEVAFLLREQTGVTLDWLYFGEPWGLPSQLVHQLTGFSLLPRAVPTGSDLASRMRHPDQQAYYRR